MMGAKSKKGGVEKSTAKGKEGSSNSSSSSSKKKGSGETGDDDKDLNAKSKSKLKPATAINVRHILCLKNSHLESALAQLRSGRKFDDVAREFSQDKARQGGSLGWKVRGSLDAAFEKAAYEVEVSTTGNPRFVEVRTEHGFHVIMVEGRR